MNESQNIKIAPLIVAGEGSRVEFKASLRVDLATGKANKELTKVVAKTIAGFLNAQGGTLLIGVGDQGDLVGIEADINTLPKKNIDGFEQNLRLSLGNYLGVEVTPSLVVLFEEEAGVTVACVHCRPWHEPVFFKDSDRQEFYVRDGNLTRPLDVRASHAYISHHWSADVPINREGLKALVADVLRDLGTGLPIRRTLDAVVTPEDALTDALQPPGESIDLKDLEKAQEGLAAIPIDELELAETLAAAAAEIPLVGVVPEADRELPPPWLRVATRRVLNLFLRQLASSQGWKRLYIISPWISELGEGTSLSFDLLLQRLKEDGTTVYLVTRPPEEPWHEAAVARFADTGRVNVAYVADLHVKLYTALTNQGAFAMLGSANFTQQSLMNREIGLLVNAYLEGKRVVRDLNYEASQIYRMPGRKLAHKADFRAA
jgi:hypothetical protein